MPDIETIKTAIIWESMDDIVRFRLVNEDVTRFDGIYLNSSDTDQELGDYIYDRDSNILVDFVTRDEFQAAIVAGAKLITCGEN